MKSPGLARLLGFGCLPLLLVPGACSSRQANDAVGTTSQFIAHGTPATSYPEAVVVTASGLIPCSGAVLAPRVVITAGHCRSPTKSYMVVAPNAGHQQSSASSDFTTYDGNPATSSDTLLLFLDTPIRLAAYPEVGDRPVASGTLVVDIGRTLNGSVTSSDYVSPPVTIRGPAAGLGFPFNYEALPDVSEDGDSGGPIEVLAEDASSAHLIVAIVDTDTVEQNINEEEPIDLFARLDLVHDAIEAQIGAHGGLSGSAEGGAERMDGGALPAPDAGPTQDGSGGCALAPRGDARAPFGEGALAACALASVRRRRRTRKRSVTRRRSAG